ncbi:MAG TPA: hypothetical protein VHX90_01055 [Verrucomicrobiae bacterium]|jgi:hypothetical protein|nr:hypothetical protein [Verrucomicrobiae bacterium]
MDNTKHSDQFYSCARIFAVLLAGFFLIPAARAQPAGQRAVDNRFLLIFDASADMKKRVPMVQKALDNLFLTSLGKQLQPGDSVGVWTFDQDLRTGQFPLQDWFPEDAATIAADINSFIGKQHYSKTTRFDALQPLLNRVAQDSDRLTVLIFCDGETAMSGTPFDSGINQIFQQRQALQKTARQPFIIVLRAQLGQYVGCTVDFPPVPVNFPAFPPLPPPPAPTNQPPPAPPPKRVAIQSIIMIGTNSETKPPPAPPAPKLEVTNSPLPAAPTNPVVETNVVLVPEKISTVQTNAPAPPPENSGSGSGGTLAVGAAFLVAAGGLTVFMLRRSRKNSHASLITRSMKKK